MPALVQTNKLTSNTERQNNNVSTASNKNNTSVATTNNTNTITINNNIKNRGRESSIFTSYLNNFYNVNSNNNNNNNNNVNNSSIDMIDQNNPDAYTLTELMPYLSDEEKISLEDEAINMLNSELLRSEDLEVAVPRLLRTCASEARELRRAMNSLASAQITEAQRALHIVKQSQRQMRSLQRLFRTQGELIEGMAGESITYAQLRQLHTLRENVNAVIEWSNALKEVRYGNLYILIECWQFAEIYKRLVQLQHIRRTVIEKAKEHYATYQTFFEPYFVKLNAVLSHFVNEVLNMLSNDAMNIAIQRALDDLPDATTNSTVNNETVDRFPEFTALKECVMVCNEEISHPVLQYRTDKNDEEASLNLKVIEAAIAKGVSKMWDEHILGDIVDPIGQISTYLEQIKRIEPLLEALEFILVPLSTSFSFFGCVVRAVHAEVIKVMRSLLEPNVEVEAVKLMEANEFVQWYKTMMSVTFNYSSYISLEPLDRIAASFITSAVDGLSAHLIRLSRSCAINACAFQSSPTILASGCPITTGPVDLFTVLRQSIAGISPAVELSVMCQIGTACADAIRAYIDECKQRSDFDYWEDENVNKASNINNNNNTNNNNNNNITRNDWQERRMLFLYAFCNDCNTIENNLDAIEMRFANCWTNSVSSNDSLLSTQDMTHASNVTRLTQGKSEKRVSIIKTNNETVDVPHDDGVSNTNRIGNNAKESKDKTEPFTSTEGDVQRNAAATTTLKSNEISPFIAVHDDVIDAAFYYLDEIVLQVERVVGEQWALAFRPGPWYSTEDNPIQLIIVTQLDYVEKEFNVMLQGQRTKKIARQMVVRYVIKYISALVEFAADVIRVPKKYMVEDWNKFVDAVVRDTHIFVSMWSSHVSLVGGQLLNLAQRAFELLKDLLAVKKTVDFAFIVENQLLDDFGDCPTFVIRFILTARQTNLEKNVRERMLEIWQDKIAYQHRIHVKNNNNATDVNDGNDKPTTNWNAPTSFFGSIDRTLSQLDKTSRFFRKSAKKRREEMRLKEVQAEKEAKRVARELKREKDTAATAALISRRSNSLPRVQSNVVQVEKLSDVLKQSESVDCRKLEQEEAQRR